MFQSKNTPTSSVPAKVHLEFLRNVSERDAQEYAYGFVRSKTTSPRLFSGIFAHGEGFIVEVHEGGEGKAYTPALLAALNDSERDYEANPLRALLRMGSGLTYLSLSRSGLTGMGIPDGTALKFDLEAAPSAQKLDAVKFETGSKVLATTRKLFFVSVGVALLAIALRPGTPSITVERVDADTLPLAQWVNDIKWPADAKPTTLRMNKKSGELELVTHKATAQTLVSQTAPAQGAPAAAASQPVPATAPATPAPSAQPIAVPVVQTVAPAASAK